VSTVNACKAVGMTPVAKITVSLASLALLAGITACAPTSEPAPVAEATQTASATLSPEPVDEAAQAEPVAGAADTAPVWCNTSAAPKIGTTPYDQGPQKGAMGEVEVVDGVPTSYVVADNDSLPSIGERFCIDYATIAEMTLGADAESFREIHPGDVLALRP